MYKFIVAFVLLALTACQSTTPVKQEAVKLLVTPSVGADHKAFMGDTLITQGYGQFGEALHTTGGTYDYSVIPQGIWKLARVGKKEKVYKKYKAPGDNGVLNGLKTKLVNKSTNFITLELADNELCHYDMGISVGCTTDFSVDEKHFFTTPRKLQQTIIYTGKSKSVLNFTYREFINDMARPSFTIDFNIDMDDGKEFAFKGAVFEVLKANNSGLSYKILKPFK